MFKKEDIQATSNVIFNRLYLVLNNMNLFKGNNMRMVVY